MRTQAVVAQRWRENGMFPWATDQGPGRPGNDIINTPRLKVEVKARQETGVTIPAALRQAAATKGEGMPILIWRHNGQGETHQDHWTVSMYLGDFDRLWTAAQNWERHCQRERLWTEARGTFEE